MPCYSERIIDAAVEAGYVERESLGIVNPSILMWDMLKITAQMFCSDSTCTDMENVCEEGDYFAVPDDEELLKSLEGLLMIDDYFMARVSEQFNDDPIRYISMGYSTGGEMNTFNDNCLHTFINNLPVVVQRFCYRQYESEAGSVYNPETETTEAATENPEDEEYDSSDDDEEEEPEEDDDDNISDAPTEIVTDDEYSDMPDLIEDPQPNSQLPFQFPGPEHGIWSVIQGEPGVYTEFCDLTHTNNPVFIQV